MPPKKSLKPGKPPPMLCQLTREGMLRLCSADDARQGIKAVNDAHSRRCAFFDRPAAAGDGPAQGGDEEDDPPPQVWRDESVAAKCTLKNDTGRNWFELAVARQLDPQGDYIDATEYDPDLCVFATQQLFSTYTLESLGLSDPDGPDEAGPVPAGPTFLTHQARLEQGCNYELMFPGADCALRMCQMWDEDVISRVEVDADVQLPVQSGRPGGWAGAENLPRGRSDPAVPEHQG